MKKRETHRTLENRKDKDGNLLCLIPVCQTLRAMGKNGRLRNYCSNHSYLDIGEYVNWQDLRMKALKRDNFTCAKCGKQPMSDSNQKGEPRKPNTHALVGDHIIPIALGGEEFDIDNVQTLCIPCNKIKTSADIKKIAFQRRREKQKKAKFIKI